MAEASILDQLKIVIGLDSSKFEEGRKKINAGFDDTKNKARQSAEEMEESGKQASQFFEQITNKALKLGTILLGGVGLKDFLANSVKTGNALGYMAKNIGISAKELNTWQTVVRSLGYDAESVGPTLNNVAQGLEAIKLTGKDAAGLFPAFQSIGVQLTDASGKLKTATQLFQEAHVALTQVGKDGKPRYTTQDAIYFANLIGASEGLTQALLQNDAAWKNSFARAGEVSNVTERQIAIMQRLTTVWETLGSTIHTSGYGAIETIYDLFNQISTGVDKAKKEINSFTPTMDGFRKLIKEGREESTIFDGIIKGAESATDAVKKMINAGQAKSSFFDGIVKGAEAAFGALAKGTKDDLALLVRLNDYLIGLKNRFFEMGGAIAGMMVGVKLGTAAAPFLGPLAPFAPVIGGAIGLGTGAWLGHSADKTRDTIERSPYPRGPQDGSGSSGPYSLSSGHFGPYALARDLPGERSG